MRMIRDCICTEEGVHDGVWRLFVWLKGKERVPKGSLMRNLMRGLNEYFKAEVEIS
jgi:hypothetical protein